MWISARLEKIIGALPVEGMSDTANAGSDGSAETSVEATNDCDGLTLE